MNQSNAIVSDVCVIPFHAIVCLVMQCADAGKVVKTKLFLVRQPVVHKILIDLLVSFTKCS